MTAQFLNADPEDANALLAPVGDGSGTYRIFLRTDDPEEVADSWCLGCEALDADKTWRFTREQAARIDWLICGDCVDMVGDLF